MTFSVTFPERFRWGVATAAYQVEGATTEDGRGQSIWDSFVRIPGRVHKGETGDVACDHYHKFRDDIALMRELKVAAYRLSVSWPRVQPDGRGRASHGGMDFYDRLVDELRAAAITPVVTLYHWDLPQALEEHGGWPRRDTAYRFADYAALVHDRLGDRVQTWLTLNEPWCSAFLGYASGEHAPGRRQPSAAFAACHHLLLGHGLAVRALREAGAGEIGVALNLPPVMPADPDDVNDRAAATHIDGLHNRLFLDPILRGAYPSDVVDATQSVADWSLVASGDEGIIGQPLELLGVNYYRPLHVMAQPDVPALPEYPGADGIVFLPPTGNITAMNWPIEPSGLTLLLTRLATEYPGTPLMVTENGAPFDDHAVDDGVVQDNDRIAYLEEHLRAAHEAIRAGADLRGYFVWSFMDNFEWAHGYSVRFGIVHVDYATMRRTPKASGYWYRNVIAHNGLD